MKESITFEKLPFLVKDLIGEIEALKELVLRLGGSKTGNESSQYLGVTDVAEFLGLSKSTVYSKVSKREIPHIKRGKKLYFLKEDITKYLNENRVSTIDELQGSVSLKLRGGEL